MREVLKVVRYRYLCSCERKLYFHYIISQLALAFGFQDELSNIVLASSADDAAKKALTLTAVHMFLASFVHSPMSLDSTRNLFQLNDSLSEFKIRHLINEAVLATLPLHR
jgi:hypothetical protein